MGAQVGGGQDGAAARDILETAIERFRKCYLSVRTYKGEVVEARFP